MDVEMNNNNDNNSDFPNGCFGSALTSSATLSGVTELSVTKRDLDNDDDEIWEGLASHLLTSDDIVTLDLVSGDDDLMPPDLMTCEATVESFVKLDPNRFASFASFRVVRLLRHEGFIKRVLSLIVGINRDGTKNRLMDTTKQSI